MAALVPYANLGYQALRHYYANNRGFRYPVNAGGLVAATYAGRQAFNNVLAMQRTGRQIVKPVAEAVYSLGKSAFSRRRSTRRTMKVIKPIRGKKTLKKQVQQLQRIAKSSMGTLIYRQRTTSRILSSVNQKNYGFTGSQNETSQYETVLAQLRFFNPSTPGTLVQGNGSTGTYYRQFLFKSVASKLQVSNNYQVPCRVRVYCCMTKRDTNINPATAFENGLADIGAPSANSILTYPTDSKEFNDLYSIVKKRDILMQPGKIITCNYAVKNIMYEPALSDDQTQTYQKKNKTFFWFIMVYGALGHDSSADQQGTLSAGIDVMNTTTYTVEYDAGIDLKYVYIDDTSDSFTNGGLVSEKPVADNIAYSVS